MTALAWALAITLTPTALIAAWMFAHEWMARRQSSREPHPSVGLTSQEWAELTALQDRARAELADPTPVYDALVCEQIERAEGWRA